MAHTTLDSSFSIWFSSAVNTAVSLAQRSRSLLCHFLSPQGYGVVHPQGQIPTPNASCFPKGAPALLWIWCLELAVWNLNTQKLVLTVLVMFIRESKAGIFLGGRRGTAGRRGEEHKQNKNLSLWLIGWKDVSNSAPLNWMWAQIKKKE